MQSDLVEFLYQAVASEAGIVLSTDDANRLRQKLYALRKGQEQFACLSFVISPFNGVDLWIVNNGGDNAEEG